MGRRNSAITAPLGARTYCTLSRTYWARFRSSKCQIRSEEREKT